MSDRDSTADADGDATEVLPAVSRWDDDPLQRSTSGANGDLAETDVPNDARVATPSPERNWMGITALGSGAVLLSPVAVVLGHMGLVACKDGRATNRPIALAGLILGYIGFAATLAVGALWYLVWGPAADRATVDVHAQQDVVAVGVAVAEHWVDPGTAPTVAQVDGGYQVDGESIPATLETDHTLTYFDQGPLEWCLMIEYEGGNEAAFSYLPRDGVLAGVHCEPPPEPEPSPSPSPSPSASASPTPSA